MSIVGTNFVVILKDRGIDLKTLFFVRYRRCRCTNKSRNPKPLKLELGSISHDVLNC